MNISIIVAVSENLVIGKDNKLVWNLRTDMNFFKTTTSGHHVIMGRKNYDSIPAKWRPLPNRTNIVVTRQSDLELEGCIVINSIEKGLEIARNNNDEEAFIIGGGEIYKQSMELVDKIYYTEVKAVVDGDTFFPDIDVDIWMEVSREKHESDERNEYDFDIVVYTRK
jgi:dihydrofolate reductase